MSSTGIPHTELVNLSFGHSQGLRGNHIPNGKPWMCTHTTLPPSPSPEAPTQALVISPLSLGSFPNGFPWNLAFSSVLGKAHCVSYFSIAVVSTMTEATYKFNLGLLVSGARAHGHHSGEHDSRKSNMGLEK